MKKNKPKIYRNFSVKLNYVHWAIELFLKNRTALKINANHYQLSTINYPLILFFALLTIPGCKCSCDDPTDPDCKNYDPCYGIDPPLTADFDMYNYVDPLSSFYGPDTLLKIDDTMNGGTIVFIANEENADSYEWHVGSGVYDTRQVSLNLLTAPDSTSIPVTLTVRKKPNLACYPNGDSILTLEKSFYRIGNYDKCMFQGIWEGYYLDTPGFKDTLHITGRDSNYNFGIYGISPGFDSAVTSDLAARFAWYFESAANENKSDMYFRGYCFVNSTKDSISFYWEQESPRDVLDWPGQRTFVGWRID